MELSAPPPDLRIVATDSVFPHETHDSQRSKPLMEKLRKSETMINPPIVAPVDASRYVILDGANRCYTFKQLNYPHIIVQVMSYESGYVQLSTWQHVVSGWSIQAFIATLKRLVDVEILDGQHKDACAHIIFKDGQIIALRAPIATTHERNAVLREVVGIYQQNATLYRTAIDEPEDIWALYPEAIAYVLFPHYTNKDITAAAKYQAYLPPGISRHIINGRALKVNFPMDVLRDETMKLSEKNQYLQTWMQNKLTNRQIRYYAESTYQFDE